MKCTNCSFINPDDSRFCSNCGKPFERVCPNCGTLNSPQSKFCNNCGFSLNAAPDSTQPIKEKTEANIAGERRIVTILFCDVAGSTAMAENMDPEEWTGIMNRAFQELMQPVYRYEGTVARLMGDAILAFFGAPVAHEDDPQRAVLAGLDILANNRTFRQQVQQQYGLDFNLRIGINTGLVVVGKVGGDYRTEYTAMGDAVNLAARMEQTARPGTLQIAEDTYRLVANLFDFQPLGEIEVKGKQEPVKVYQVLGRKEGAVPTRGIAGMRSPLVGRQAEFDLLRQQAVALLEGQGHFVSIIGEAGLGKSRLAAELHHWLTRQSDPAIPAVGWYEGRSLSYQTHSAYAPFIDLFRQMFALQTRSEDAAQAYSHIRSQVAEVCDQPETIAPFLAVLLGIDVSPQDADRVKYLAPPQLRERIFSAVAEWIGCLAARQKVVLVFEDLHWMDPASLDLLVHLLASVERLPVLVISLFRPNKTDPSWQVYQDMQNRYSGHFTALTLQPLDDAQSRVLIGNLLEIEDLPERVRSLVLQKAEGNPFFVEEVIRSLLDAKLVVRDGDHWRATREIASIAIPDTLAGVITARLDRLNEVSRQVTQEAAIIGREFSYPILVALHTPAPGQTLDDALEDLERRELVREKMGSAQRAYLFKHGLTQETVYASLLHSRRRMLHRQVAEYLQQADPDRPEEIARHFMESQEKLRAFPYLVQAGNRAGRTYATAAAIGYYQAALEMAAQIDDNQLVRQAYEGLGRALTFANRIPAVVELYQSMHAAGVERQDIPMRVSALNKLSEIMAMRMGQFPEAEKLLSQAEELAGDYDDKPGLAEMFMMRCAMCTAKGDFPGAVSYLGKSVIIARSMEHKADVALGLGHIANTRVWMTEFDQAWETAQQSLKISREIGNLELQSEVMSQCIPMVLMSQGDYAGAYQWVQEGTNIAAQIGASFPESMGAFLAGRIALECGDYETAVAWEQQALRAGHEHGMIFISLMALCTLGTIYLNTSETLQDKTREYHNQALQQLEMPGGSVGGGIAWADLGFCALDLGDDQSAEKYFHMGLDNPTPQMLIMRPNYLAGLALVYNSRGDLEAAQASLDQARQYAVERKLTNSLPLLELVQGQIDLNRADPQAAYLSFDRAAEQAAAMQARPVLWQARAGAAQALEQLGRTPEAQQRRSEGQAVVQEIAGLFKNEEFRQAFLNSARQKVLQSS